MRTLRRTFVAILMLGLAGLSPVDTTVEAAEGAKGVVIEVQDQNNARVTFELREAGPSHKPDAGVLRFARKLGPTLEQTAWYEKPLTGDLGLREIRIAGEPLELQGAGGRLFHFYPVVLVPREGVTASWLWEGEVLSGVVTSGEGAPRPFSIPIQDVKVVRFPS